MAVSPLIASPLLFGVPVALGLVISVTRLIAVRDPDLNWATVINSDAEQLYLGHTLYQNPAHGYTGVIYTALFPAVVSLFDHLYLWNGWSLLLVIGASIALAALAARIAYVRAGPARRAVSILGAAGIGGIAYWCVSSVGLSLLDEARSDQLAWAFALFGLVAVADFGPAPSRRRVVVAALLLSAALWTKQPTVAVVVPVCAWVVGLAAFSALKRRAAVLFGAVLCGVNLAILLGLNLLTHGWEFYINFEMDASAPNERSLYESVVTGLRSGALAVGFVAVTWLASAVYVAIHRRRRSMRPSARGPTGGLREILAAQDPTGRRILLLGLYIVFGFALAVYIMRKQGTDTNHMLGVVWALGLLAAAGWRVAQRHLGTAAAAGGCVAMFFLLVNLGPTGEWATKQGIMIPAFERALEWPAVPVELSSWARNHSLYISTYPDLNVAQGGPLYPGLPNLASVLAAGIQPLYLARAFLDRRFEGVGYFSLEYNAIMSAYGKWEENYMWKLDEVIAARYTPMPGLPQGVLGRRPGPERDVWMRDCFGPFAAGGVSFRIRHGGGFWCSFSPNGLRLVRTPAPVSEVVTTQPVRLAGMISVGLGNWATTKANLVVEGEGGVKWVAAVAAAPGKSRDVVISTYLDGALLGFKRVTAAILSGGQRGVRLSVTQTHGRPGVPIPTGPGAATITAPAVKAPFSLVASQGATMDLHAMRLGR